LLAAVHRLDLRLRLHDDLPAPGLIRLANAFRAKNQAGCGEIGSRQILHQVGNGRLRMVNQIGDGVCHLPQVVRGHVGRHADGDAAAAVTDEVRKLARQHHRLHRGLVVVGLPVHCVFIDILHHLHRQRRQAAFGITHRRGRVAVHAAEVALSVDQRIAHAEVLRHAHQGGIQRLVAVRVEAFHRLPTHGGAFHVGTVGGNAHLAHRVEDSPLHRLQPVAHIGQGARDDGAHGITEVRTA